MQKQDMFKLVRNGQEVNAEILDCFQLNNGNSYLLYKYANEEDVYASLVIENEDKIILDDVNDEDIEAIEDAIKRSSKKEVD